jgi:hypothetical protein
MKEWQINEMTCEPSKDGLTDVVVYCNYTRKAVEVIDGIEYHSALSDVVQFLNVNPVDFTPYEDITYELVCEWLNASVNVEFLDGQLDKLIQNQVSPQVITLPLPFNNPSAPVEVVAEEPAADEVVADAACC